MPYAGLPVRLTDDAGSLAVTAWLVLLPRGDNDGSNSSRALGLLLLLRSLVSQLCSLGTLLLVDDGIARDGCRGGFVVISGTTN